MILRREAVALGALALVAFWYAACRARPAADSARPAADPRARTPQLEHGHEDLTALEERLERLEARSRARPADARVWTELAAAHLKRARAAPDWKGAERLMLARDAALRAAELAPRDPDACFYLALASEGLRLRTEARDAWQLYLNLDRSSSRREEARRHLARLKAAGEGALWQEGRKALEAAAGRGDGRSEKEARTIIDRFPQPAAELAGEELLGRWGKAWLQGRREEAAATLGEARWIAHLLASRTGGDRMVEEAVSTIDAALGTAARGGTVGARGAAGTPGARGNRDQATSIAASVPASGDSGARGNRNFARLRALALGHRLYRDARRQRDDGSSRDTRDLFARAADLLQRGGSPFALWPALYVAIGDSDNKHLQLANGRLEELIGDRRLELSPDLQVRTHWMLGLVALLRGDPELAFSSYQTAIDGAQAEHAREEEMTLRAELAAAILIARGDGPESWQEFARALELAVEVDNVRRLDPLLGELAEAATARHPAVARALYHEMVALQQPPADPAGGGKPAMSDDELAEAAHALIESAKSSFQLVRAAHGEAERRRARRWLKDDLDQARKLMKSIGKLSLRRRDEADLRIAESTTLEHPGPSEAAAAITKLSDAIFYFSHYGRHHPFLAGLYRERARTRREAGKPGAEADLWRGIQEFEQVRGKVSGEDLRVSFFEQARGLFDDLIGLLADQGRAGDALAAAERARGRALLDRLDAIPREALRSVVAGAGSAPLELDKLRRELPEGVVAIEYWLLPPDQLLIWVVTRSDLQMIREPAGELAQDAADWTGRLAGEDDGAGDEKETAPRQAERLYDALLRKALAGREAGTRLLLVPDQAFQALPFAALRDRDRPAERLLIEDHVLAVAPSISASLRALRRYREIAPSTPRLCAAADPRVDPGVAHAEGGFEDLPDVRQVAADLATKLFGSPPLLDEHATKSAFLAAAKHHELVLFAGHAVVNPMVPLLSHLVLAADPASRGDNGLLYAHEIYRQRFPRTRLIVLAACSTAAGPGSAEGPLGIARAFLASGVPQVVATLWNVDDRRTSMLIKSMGGLLHDGVDPATALALAQREMLHRRDGDASSPGGWAAFQLFGAMPPPADPRPTSRRR